MSAFAREATVELSSQWEFSTDPGDVGVDEGWYSPMVSLPDARTVELPHVWQEHETLCEYTGVGWYRRSFSSSSLSSLSLSRETSDGRVLLRFGAVDYEATVWVNGTKIGSNRGGYLPFQFDVTDALCAGENVIVVRVYDPEDLSEIPHGKQGHPWYTRVSGIWQDVSLTTVPDTYITSARVTPDLDSDSATIAVETNKTTEASDLRARVSVTQDGRTLGSSSTALAAGGREITVDLDDPSYWTPETPVLCDFEVELVDSVALDTYRDYFGMRSVAVEDGNWYLNGEPLSVRGALDQAYYPDTFYRPSGSIGYRAEIEMAKDLGFNMLRKHIKPAHPEFLELADELGMLVWEEPANPSVYTERSKRELREQFERLVQRDYNRPSVIVWSLYNEEWGIGLDQNAVDQEHSTRLWNDEDKQEYLAEFYDASRELDPTRLICDNSGWAHVRTDVNDYHEYFIVPDRADAWREKLDTIVTDPGDNYATTAHDDPEDTPIVVSEFGTWGLPNVERLRAHYEGDPHWFDHDFLDGLRRPAGIDARFEASALSGAFDDLPSLATAWQRRALGSIETLLRDMRTTERLSGYVITEFTDIEWEFNGILDYLREPKPGLDGFADANAPVTGWAVPHERVFWDDDSLVADLVVVNDTVAKTTVTVEWEAFDRSGVQTIEIAATETERVTDAIDVAVPSVETPRTGTITVRLPDRDVTTSTEIAVVPNSTMVPDITVAVADETLSASLEDRGYELSDSEAADITIETGSIGDVSGETLVLPASDGGLESSIDGISITTLPERESWNLCACFVSQTLFEEIDIVPGWAFEDLYPYAYVDSAVANADVTVAYAEGWLANHGAISLTRETDAGTLGICSLRVTDQYGEHPMATVVLDRLLEQFV